MVEQIDSWQLDFSKQISYKNQPKRGRIMTPYLRTIWTIVDDAFVHVGVTNLPANTNEGAHCQISMVRGIQECENNFE